MSEADRNITDIVITTLRHREATWRRRAGTEYMDEHQRVACAKECCYQMRKRRGALKNSAEFVDVISSCVREAERARWGDI